MKPPPFSYVAARDIGHAVTLLADAGGDAKLIAGGQSLMPMLNFRLVKPTVLIDINRIPGLDRIEERDDRLIIGALVRHRTTATDPLVAARFPVIHQAMQHVAHYTIRNRGTFVGSVCHADPAAEMPMMALLFDAVIRAVSHRGERRIAALDFFVAPLATALEGDEFVTAIELPCIAPDAGWGFAEFARRDGDFALASVAATVEVTNGVASAVRIGLMGVGDTPLRAHAAEEMLLGTTFADDDMAAAVEAIRTSISPNSDLHASSDYRRHLAGVLAARVLRDAWARAGRRTH